MSPSERFEAESANVTDSHSRPMPRWVRKLPGGPAAWLVLVLCLVATAASTAFFVRNYRENARARFADEVRQVTTAIERRMLTHELVLRGAAGLFSSQIEVDRAEWKAYIAALELDQNYPGILGVGYSARILPAQKAEHEESIRAEGFPNYAIRPEGVRDEYHSIIYIEPFTGRNLKAFGFDMFSEPVRHAAMERARDTGIPTLSGRVKLVQEGKVDVQPGLLYYLPIYKRNMPTTTVEQRREALQGFVYSPYRTFDLFENFLRNFEQVAIEVFDGEALSDNLLYASPSLAGLTQPMLVSEQSLDTAGRKWRVRVSSTPAFEKDGAGYILWLVPFVGMSLSLLMFYVTRSLTHTTARAHGLAREMTRELARSESALQTILDTAADGIMTLDEQRRITSFSHAATRIFGVEADSAIGTPIEDLIPSASQRWLNEQSFSGSGEAGSTESAHTELLARRVDGTEFPVAVSISRYWQNRQALYTFTVRDITEKKLAEAQILLRDRALESSDNGIVISDMTLPGQPIMYVNPAFERITGYSADEVIGRNCKFLQGLEIDQPAVEELRAAIAASEPCHVILRNYRKDGTQFWNELTIAPVLNAEGRATHYVGVQNDISERIDSEQTLMVRTHRLDAVFSLSLDGFVAFDNEGRLTIANPAMLRMTGFELGEVIGLTEAEFDVRMASLCDPSRPYPTLCDTLQSAIARQEDADSDTAIVSTLHLERPGVRVLERSVRVGSAGGQEKVLYFRDITREAEVDRMKSEFLSTAAHELRTPMASIFGFAELLLKRNYDDATRKRLLETIHRQSQLLINLVNELLDLARIEARAGKDFRRNAQPIKPIIENTVASLLVNNDTRRVNMVLPDEMPVLMVDDEKIQQALTNVLSNAYKYSPDGGEITLKVIESEKDGRGMLGISVKDEGIGMTPEQLARVFERFFRADPSGNIPGTGLGMSLVKEIVELHGGRVQVESTYGQGTTVTLWLPTHVEETSGDSEARLAA